MPCTHHIPCRAEVEAERHLHTLQVWAQPPATGHPRCRIPCIQNESPSESDREENNIIWTLKTAYLGQVQAYASTENKSDFIYKYA